MSKRETIKTIRAEIEKINQVIDLKIIRGASYRREALQHKILMAKLARISSRESWLSRSFGALATFIF